MPAQKKTQATVLDTHDLPTQYVNQAQFTMSYHELRIFLSEISPKKVTLGVANIPTENLVIPKVSVIMTPEFGKALLNALKNSIDKYEATYGKLREKPEDETSKAK